MAKVFAQMDKITVAELAAECSVKNQVVLAELKRLGLYVFAPSATIDANFAETIRKKILSQREAEAAKVADAAKKKEEAAKKAEKKAAKKAAAPKEAEKKTAAKPEKEAAAAPPPKARKSPAKKAKPVEKPPVEEAPKPSLAPRKGRKHYDRESAELVDIVPAKPGEEAAGETPVPAAAAPPAPAEEQAEVEAAQAEASREEAAPAEAAQAEPPSASQTEQAQKPLPAAARPATRQPATVSKTIVVPKKSRAQILMQTRTETVVSPGTPDRILKHLRGAGTAGTRVAQPPRFVKKGSS